MKSPEAAIRAVLIADDSVSDQVASRIYPVIAPSTAELPFLVYRRGSIQREATFTGPLGNPTVQLELTIMDSTYESVRELADTVRNSIDGWTGVVDNVLIHQTFLQNETDGFAQLQGAEMPAVYTVTQIYDLIWEEIDHHGEN